MSEDRRSCRDVLYSRSQRITSAAFVQNMATAHFGASVRNFVITETRISQNTLIGEMAEEKVQVADGKLAVPDGPGLGITLIPEVLRENLIDGEPYWD